LTDKPTVEDAFELSEDDFPCNLPRGNDDIIVDLTPLELEQFAAEEQARSRIRRRSSISRSSGHR
jgi:hypothetical protein